jgi:hypothetical protein
VTCNNCFFYLCDAIDPPISISPVGSGNRRKLYRCDGKLGDVFDYFILACSHTSCIHHSTAYSNLGRGRSSIDMWDLHIGISPSDPKERSKELWESVASPSAIHGSFLCEICKVSLGYPHARSDSDSYGSIYSLRSSRIPRKIRS